MRNNNDPGASNRFLNLNCLEGGITGTTKEARKTISTVLARSSTIHTLLALESVMSAVKNGNGGRFGKNGDNTVGELLETHGNDGNRVFVSLLRSHVV